MYASYFAFLAVPALLALDRDSPWRISVAATAAIIASVLVGFRAPGVDRDYTAYVATYFHNLPPISQFFRLSNLLLAEPGIRLLGSIVRGTLHLPVRYVFVTLSVLSVSLKLRAFQSIAPQVFCLSVVIYLSNYFLLHEMTQIRIGMASAFFLLSVPDIVHSRRRRFVWKVLVATMFHYSAVFFFFAYPLRRNSRHLLSTLLIVVLAAQILLRVVLPAVFEAEAIRTSVFARLGSYFIGRLSSGTINFANPLVWYRLAVLFLMHGPFRRLTSTLEDPLRAFVTNMYTVGTVLFFGLFSTPVLSLRLSQLFFVIDPIAIPLLLRGLLNDRDARFAVVATSGAFLAGNLFLIRLVNPLVILV